MAKSFHQATLPGVDWATDSAKQIAASAHDPDLAAASPDSMTTPLFAARREAGPIGPPESLAGKSVWVVDANSLIFQVFHALPEMTSPQGEPVSAVFGFTRDILEILDNQRPDYLLIALDASERTFRHELYEHYKANRGEMPEDLIPQYDPILRMLAGLGVPVLVLEGYEADDLIATVATQVDRLGGQCVVVSGDKDCRQLITERVKVYNIRKQQLYDAAALEADWGVRPEQVVDFQALVGDSVDNVPGVPLVGPKLASEYLRKFGTLDELLNRAGELPPGKRRDNLIASRQQVLVSRQLVRLDRDVPIDIDWRPANLALADRAVLNRLFHELGFRGLTQRFAPASQPAGSVTAAPQSDVRYELINTPERLAWLASQLRAQPAFALDTETTHVWPRWAELVGLSFAWREKEAYYVPVRGPAGETVLDLTETLNALRGVLEDPTIGKVGQNLKYDLIVLRAAGVRVAGVRFDTMIASYLLDAGQRSHNLDQLAQTYLQHQTTKIVELIGAGKSQKRMDEVPLAQITHYAAEDADITWRLYPLLAQKLREAELQELFERAEMPLVEVLVELESNGIRIDPATLAGLSQKYGERAEHLEREIYDLAGHEFNIGSTKQLQQILFDQQKLPMLRRTKTGGSTDADVLEELARLHPLPAKIIEYRQYTKLKNTYVDALPLLVHPQTARVHASFNQVVAATGRLSCGDPNLQNIPVRNETGREIRTAFLPAEPGWKLLAADYSQIELRVLAHLSGDQSLLAAFAQDEDIHALVASQVNAVPVDSVTGAMRRQAKAVNFGVIYGQSPFGLAKQLGIEQEEAARFINAYFDKYAGVEEFLARILEQCLRSGYVSTILGRRRAIRGIRRVVSRQRNLPERTAINTVIQGSAADLIKLAMINIHGRMVREQLQSRMLLQIHDELVFEVPPHELALMARLVPDEMSDVMRLNVPLRVDLKTGDNWADCQDWL